MAKLGDLTEALSGIAGINEIPEDMANGAVFHADLEDGASVAVFFNPTEARWVLSVTRPLTTLSDDSLTDLHEVLLRRSFDARYTEGCIGALDDEGQLYCSVMPIELPNQPDKVEELILRLIHELDLTTAASESSNIPAPPPNPSHEIASNWIRA